MSKNKQANAPARVEADQIAALQKQLKTQEEAATLQAETERKQNLERIEKLEAALKEQAERSEPAFDPSKMTGEQIATFNAAEKEKQDELFRRQEINRTNNAPFKPRDENIIRGIEGKDQIKCVTARKVGLDDGVTSDINETISIPKSVAKKLQDSGAIKIEL